MNAEAAPACPVCGGSMARRQVRRGARAGLEMWGCERWPECGGAINIDPHDAGPPTAGPSGPEPRIQVGEPGAWAQRRYERARDLDVMRRRAILPLVTASALITMTGVWFVLQPLGQLIAGFGALATGVGFMFMIPRLPFDSLQWARGIEGERRAGVYLEPLLEQGYVVLYNRFVPGASGDIDSLVVGPTGVFVVEVKNWSKKLDVRGGRLWVDGHERTHALNDLVRRSVAAQVLLADVLTPQRATVIAIVCAIGGLGIREATAAGVQVTDGKGLARLIANRPIIFDDDTVQSIARLADQRMRSPYAWERE